LVLPSRRSAIAPPRPVSARSRCADPPRQYAHTLSFSNWTVKEEAAGSCRRTAPPCSSPRPGVPADSESGSCHPPHQSGCPAPPQITAHPSPARARLAGGCPRCRRAGARLRATRSSCPASGWNPLCAGRGTPFHATRLPKEDETRYRRKVKQVRYRSCQRSGHRGPRSL
jgi:hypothetical protein